MTYETFMKINERIKEQHELILDLSQKNIDLIEFVDPYHHIINDLIKEVYGDEGYDWWCWFIYDNNFGTGNLTANDKNGNSICYDYQSLWEYLEKMRLELINIYNKI